MKGKLIPLRLNELICRALILPFNYRSRFPAPIIQHNSGFYAQRHIARINPAGRIVLGIQASRMKSKLHRLGLNELLGSPHDVSIQLVNFFYLLRHNQLDCFRMRSGPTPELTGRERKAF